MEFRAKGSGNWVQDACRISDMGFEESSLLFKERGKAQRRRFWVWENGVGVREHDSSKPRSFLANP